MARIEDRFTRPGGNLIGVTPDVWSWVKIAGNDSGFLIYENKLSRTPDQLTSAVYANRNFATNDQFFEFGSIGGFATGTATLNFTGRLNYSAAASTGYAVTYTPKVGTTSGKIAVAKMGGVAQAGSSADVAFASLDYFKLRVTSVRSGTNQIITVFVNNSQLIQWTDTTGTPNVGPSFAMTSYANSARKDSDNKAFYADDFKAGDIVNPSRFNVAQLLEDVEVPIKFEAIQDGSTSYKESYIDYVVGENDAQYPPAYNAGYYNS